MAFADYSWLVMVTREAGRVQSTVDTSNPSTLERLTSFVSAAATPSQAELTAALQGFNDFTDQQLLLVPLNKASLVDVQATVSVNWSIQVL